MAAGGKLASFEKRQTKSLDLIKKGFLALGGALSIQALQRFTSESIAAADQLAKFARQTDFGIETLQRLRFAFGEAGVKQSDFDQSLARLQVRLGEFIRTGAGEAASAIKSLGLEQDITSGKIRSAEQLFFAASDKLRGYDNNAEAAAISAKLFGDEQGRLVPLLRQGSAAIEEAGKKLPALISPARAREAELMTDALGRMGGVIKTSIAEAFIRASAEAADFFGLIDRHQDRLEQMGEANARVFERIEALNAEIDKLVNVQVGAPNVERIKQLQEQVATLEKLAGRITPFRDRQARYAEAAKAGEGEGQAYIAALENVVINAQAKPVFDKLPEFDTSAFDKLQAMANRTADQVDTRFKSLGESMGRSLETTLADAFLGVETNFKEMLKRLAVQAATSKLLTVLAGVGGPVGAVAGFLGFGGGRAEGGPVSPGMAYVVGESGPEMFVPRAAGQIVPNGGNPQINVTNVNRFDVGLETVDTRIAQAAGPISAATVAAVRQALRRPSMV